jgi:hypothetical protein
LGGFLLFSFRAPKGSLTQNTGHSRAVDVSNTIPRLSRSLRFTLTVAADLPCRSQSASLVSEGGRSVLLLDDLGGSISCSVRPWRWTLLAPCLEAREVVQHGGEIAPAPPRNLEIGEVGLPELVWRGGLVLEFLGGFDDDLGQAGDKIQEPID